jgi:hypothetical protein
MQLTAFELGCNSGDFFIEERQVKIILIASINQFLKKNGINFIFKTINKSYE